jgi:hypothetical protein
MGQDESNRANHPHLSQVKYKAQIPLAPHRNRKQNLPPTSLFARLLTQLNINFDSNVAPATQIPHLQ